MSDRETRERLHIGGQAVIEGVMMRSPTCIATSVRTPAGIVTKVERFVSLTKRHRVANLPIVRGAIALIETFVIAMKALSFSADEAAKGEGGAKAEDEAKVDGTKTDGAKADGAKTGGAMASGGISPWQMALTLVAALGLGFLVFFYLPLMLTELTGLRSGVAFNLVDGLFRLAFLFLYIVLITRWKEMRRIFEYHGAEHKTIHAFEEEGTATVEAAGRYSTLHARCSTSFLLLVVVVSVIVFIFLGRPETIAERIIRFAFIPVIGGIAYEILRISAKPAMQRRMTLLVGPGLYLQRLTTKEPTPDQIEVAVAALNACLADKTVES